MKILDLIRDSEQELSESDFDSDDDVVGSFSSESDSD